MDNTTDKELNTSTQMPNNGASWGTVKEFGTIETAANYFLLIVCVATVFSDSIALHVVHRGRQLPRFCRILSMNYLVSDLTGAATFAIHQVFIFAFGFSNEVVLMSRIASTGVAVLTSSASVALISIERVLALVNNLSYTASHGAIRIAATITVIWVFNTGIILASVLLKIGTDCHWGLSSCNMFYVFSLSRIVSIALLLIYDTILIVTNLIIQRFVRRHRSQIKEQQSSSRSLTNVKNGKQLTRDEYCIWNAVAKIILSYLALHIPMTANMLIHEWYQLKRHDIVLRFVRIISYLCMQISSFVHLYFYVFKMKENKMNMYILLSRVFRRYKPRAEELRIDFYNIPVITDVGSRLHSQNSA